MAGRAGAKGGREEKEKEKEKESSCDDPGLLSASEGEESPESPGDDPSPTRIGCDTHNGLED